MATSKNTTTDDEKPVNPLPGHGDHDRVTMLSLNADGSPDQHNPEIIGDKDAALAATKKQFSQQAVAAQDALSRGDMLGVPSAGATADVQIDALVAEHEKVGEAAEKRAEQVVNDLFDDSAPNQG